MCVHQPNIHCVSHWVHCGRYSILGERKRRCRNIVSEYFPPGSRSWPPQRETTAKRHNWRLHSWRDFWFVPILLFLLFWICLFVSVSFFACFFVLFIFIGCFVVYLSISFHFQVAAMNYSVCWLSFFSCGGVQMICALCLSKISSIFHIAIEWARKSFTFKPESSCIRLNWTDNGMDECWKCDIVELREQQMPLIPCAMCLHNIRTHPKVYKANESRQLNLYGSSPALQRRRSWRYKFISNYSILTGTRNVHIYVIQTMEIPLQFE